MYVRYVLKESSSRLLGINRILPCGYQEIDQNYIDQSPTNAKTSQNHNIKDFKFFIKSCCSLLPLPRPEKAKQPKEPKYVLTIYIYSKTILVNSAIFPTLIGSESSKIGNLHLGSCTTALMIKITHLKSLEHLSHQLNRWNPFPTTPLPRKKQPPKRTRI